VITIKVLALVTFFLPSGARHSFVDLKQAQNSIVVVNGDTLAEALLPQPQGTSC
jgi:hypothetical protein